MMAISVLGLIASFLTIIASIFILWLYRRAVARFMLTQAGEVKLQGANEAQSEAVSALGQEDSVSDQSISVSLPPENRLADRLYRLTISESRWRACKYALAGVLFALLTLKILET